MTKNHLPLPWSHSSYEINKMREIALTSGDGNHIGKLLRASYSEANAEFIVRACNCHEELVQVLEAVEGWLSSFSTPPSSTIAEKEEHLMILRAALAKAKGGT